MHRFLLTLFFALPALASAETAEYWLDRMATAVQNLNYEGTYVYLHGGQLETMRIFHQAGAGGERERLVSLNGEAREVLRDNERVTCILPEHRSVMVDRSRPRKPFPADLPRDLAELTDNYRLLVVGEDRVAGKPVRVIAIHPRDELRYGYRLWLDKETDMLLRSDLTDAGGRLIEQVMFTDFRVYERLPEASLQSSLQGENFVRHEKPPMELEKRTVDVRPGWNIARLPDGFMLIDYNRHMVPTNPGPVEHLVFSDGLATISVYVEPEGAGSDSLAGLSSMGAVNAFGARVAGHQIPVVGEVPGATVELVGRSAQPVAVQ